ncbi:BBSome complex member BBS7-like isoform X3 [Rhodnius prolixus]|uniref:BBSome complex member BBS7-like isoform X3 n=1 Tax=Rhodnius prolixus TaxID=13249 RepID=UPI003D188519
MLLELTRVDYTLIGLTQPRCMKLLPNAGLKSIQKVAAGGIDGVLQVFSFKKGEIQMIFKTLPSEKISSLELGGPLGGLQDKIFVSTKNEVRGYTKKGKVFLGFDTNLTESINSMHVSGSDLLVAGTHVYNHFKDCNDMNSYLSSDTINDVIALSVDKTGRLTAILACEDRMLRVIDKSTLSFSAPLSSPPTTIALLNNDGGDTGDKVVYATQDGQLGLIHVTRSKYNWKWIIPNNKGREGARTLAWHDITKDGTQNLIVGRDDGSIQIYGEPLERISDMDPLIERYNFVCNESITSVQGGCVGNAAFDEVIATSYTGWLFGLTTEVLEKQVSLDTSNSNVKIKLSPEDKLKIDRLKNEIEGIERTVVKERARYQLATQEDSVGISVIPYLNISDKMTLIKDESLFQLTIEMETAIDNILLQSDVPIKLLDVEKNSAVVSLSGCEPNSGNKVVATYRCQVNTTKVSLIIELGTESGTLVVYVTPHAQPKACHVRTYILKHLGHYFRTHNFDNARSISTLILKGSFSMAEIHNWIAKCLPEVPEKIPISDTVTYHYMSSFIETILFCTYTRGEAVFKSDNITTISSLKDCLTRQATMKKIHLDISFDFILNLFNDWCRFKNINRKLNLIKLKEKLSDRLCTLEELQHLFHADTAVEEA